MLIKLEQINPNYWQSTWTLLLTGEKLSWDESGNDIHQVLANGVNDIAAALARRYAILDLKTTHHVKLLLENVAGLKDYARALAYLKGLIPIKDVQVQALNAGKIIFNIEYVGSERSLQNALALGLFIKPETTSNPEILRYSLR